MAYEYDPILCMMVEKPNVKTNDKAGEMWYLYVDGKSITAFESWGAPVKEAKEYMKKNNIKGVGTLKRIGRGGSFTITAKDKSTKTVDEVTLKKGQVYRNANGVRVEIISVEPNYVLVDFGGQTKDFTPFGLQKILSDNGYKKVRDAKAKDARAVDENYIISGMKSQLEQTLKRYKDSKNKNKLVSQYIGFVNNHRVNGKVTEEEYNEFVKYAKRLIGGSAGVRDANKYVEAAAKMLKEGKSGTEIIFALQRMGLTPVDAAHYYGAAKVSAHDALDKAIRNADRFTVWESDEYDDIYVSYEGGTYVLYVEGRPQADGNQQKMIQLAKQEERMRG